MPALTNVYGDLWPTSGVATAASVGINALTGTNLQHIQSLDLWQDSTSIGYVEGDTGTAISLRVDAPSGANGLFGAAPANGDIGTVGFWIRAVRTDPTLAAHSSPSYLAFGATWNVGSQVAGGGAGLTVSTLAAVIKNAASPERGSGLVFLPFPGSGANGICAAEFGHVRSGNGVSTLTASTALQANVPFERWVYVGLRIVLGTQGKYALIINDQKVGELTLHTGTTDAQVNNLLFTLPALTGVKWQLGELNSYRGNGHPTFAIKYRSPANHTLLRNCPVTFCGGGEGENWTLATTGAAQIRGFATGVGFRHYRERIVASLAAAQTVTLTSTKSYGAATYNDKGWMSLWFPEILLTPGTSGTVTVKNAGGATIAQVNWSGAGVWTNARGKNIAATGDGPCSCSLGISFNSDGRVAYLIVDNTRNSKATASSGATLSHPIVHAGPLDNWTPANFGEIVIAATASAQATVEFGGVSYHRYLAFAGIDSYTEGPHGMYSFDYISWSNAHGFTIAAADLFTDPATGVQTTVLVADNTNRWAVVATAGADWSNGTSITVTRTSTTLGTITGAAAAAKVTWMGATINSGTPARNDVVTEGTSGATAKFVMSGALDSNYVQPNTYGLVPISGTLRGSLPLTFVGGAGATATGDVPQIGVYRACVLNGDSVIVYSALQDAGAAACVTLWDPAQGVGSSGVGDWAVNFVGTLGRAGRRWGQFREAAGALAGSPSVLLWVFGGIANSLTLATSQGAAEAEADFAANCLISTQTMVTENDGLFIWQLPAFGTNFMFLNSHAGLAFSRFLARARRRSRAMNDLGRARIIGITRFSTSTDGVHPTFAGAGEDAGVGVVRSTSLPGGGGDRSSR